MLHHNIDVLESRDVLSDHHQQPRYSIAANVRILLQRVACSAMGHCRSSGRAFRLQLICIADLYQY